jgi:vacuolar-type H+-ATPase subunit I/STV1|tara:strand:- start:908 stop:1249 length:342 start_codon:yes stop_codon:yes gene_type:complete
MEKIDLNNHGGKTEQEFLEMARDCMERINQKNQEIKEIKNLYGVTQEKVAEIFGCYKKLKRYIINLCQVDSTLDFLIREIESDLHNIIFKQPKYEITYTMDVADLEVNEENVE